MKSQIFQGKQKKRYSLALYFVIAFAAGMYVLCAECSALQNRSVIKIPGQFPTTALQLKLSSTCLDDYIISIVR